jgi:hypothetical protein
VGGTFDAESPADGEMPADGEIPGMDHAAYKAAKS